MSEENAAYEVEQTPKQSKAKDRIKEIRAKEDASTMEVMSTVGGRAFVARLLMKGDMYGLSYTGNAETNFREGRRSIALHLHHELIEVCPGLYATLIKENPQCQMKQ